MNLINALKQYNSKNGELKRLKARLEVIDLRLENWDNLKASSVTDMPIYHDTENGDKIGAMICKREDLQEDRNRIELEIAELNEFVVSVQTKLDCLNYLDAWLLKRKYIEKKSNFIIYKEYNEEINVKEAQSINNSIWQLEKRLSGRKSKQNK